MDVGKRIIELREKRHISTNKLANLAGISQSYLRNIELGVTNPTVEMLEYICDALNVSLKYFFDTTSDSDEIIDSISTLTENQKEKLIAFLKAMK